MANRLGCIADAAARAAVRDGAGECDGIDSWANEAASGTEPAKRMTNSGVKGPPDVSGNR